MAAVAAGGAAAGDELLAAERKTTVPSVAGFHTDFNFVYEHVQERSFGSDACYWRRRLFSGFDADEFAVPAALAELDYASNFREQGIVLAQADIFAGLDAGAALAHDDRSAGNELSTEGFYAQSLRIRVAPVFRTA